jgi:DNA-binding CsgD family transcriptional regulator
MASIASQVRFSHISEERFARLLDVHLINWRYRPTFELDQDTRGKRQSFTPDFFLPEFDLYVELVPSKEASKRQRKIALFGQKYPDLRLCVLYRRRVHKLFDKREFVRQLFILQQATSNIQEATISKRWASIEVLAVRAARRAVSTNAEVDLPPMSAHHRFIVHWTLENYPGVKTVSRGTNAARHVVVSPKQRENGVREKEKGPVFLGREVRRWSRSIWPAGLTNREVEVLQLIERKNEEIASALYVSLKTIETHIGNIYKKIGVSKRAGAIRWAINAGIVEPL